MAFGRKLGNFTKGFLSTATPGVTRAFAAQGRREEVEKKQEFQRTEAKTEREFQKQIADSDQMLDMIYGATTAAELRDLEDVVASQYPQFIDQLAARRAGINAAKREGEEAEERKLLRSTLQAALRTDPKAAEQIAIDLGMNKFARLARDKNLNLSALSLDYDLNAAELRDQALRALENNTFNGLNLEQILERLVNAHEAARQGLIRSALSQPGTDLWSYEQTAPPSEPGSEEPGWFEEDSTSAALATGAAVGLGAHQGGRYVQRSQKPETIHYPKRGGVTGTRTMPQSLAQRIGARLAKTRFPTAYGRAIGVGGALLATEGAGFGKQIYDYLTGDEEATEPLPYEPE